MSSPMRIVRHPAVLLGGLLFLLMGMAVGSAGARSLAQDQIEEGARLYAENCAVCHGDNGEGRVGATLAKDWPTIRPDLRVKETISNGVEGSVMPAWSEANGGPLSVSEIEAITAYILTWETGGSRLIAPPPTTQPRPEISPVPNVQGDPNRGAILYDQNCLVCHGVDGQGRIGATLARNWATIRPDLRVKETITNGVEGSVMPAWGQSEGGPLSERDIDDLTAYILSWEGDQVEQLQNPQATPETQLNPILTGWGGALLAVALFGIIVAVAVLLQTRQSS